jgi:UDP-N-acetylmuramoyl-L-alanyl-D-glutamate--2,6-diaminopimelate ligase
MAAVAEKFAQVIVLTNDNPRGESPEAIIQEILAGFTVQGRQRVQVRSDRRRAIGDAIAQARQGDIVLIAGKGHENYQIIGQNTLPFDDADEARQALSGLTLNRKDSPEGGQEI